VEVRSFAIWGGSGKVTTHLVAFSLRTELVWRTPLRSAGPPWSVMEQAAERSGIFGLDQVCCQGFCSYVGRGFGLVWAIVLEAGQMGIPWYLPVSTYRIPRLRRG
jgi:hypothetical protein